jgi:thiopurine S-methyltransferase
MDAAFWLHRWQEGRIGWHQEEVSLLLERLWAELELSPAGRVLVPLCGKSRDLAWLAGQGHRVLGVEISPLAVETFFREQGVTPNIRELAPFQSWSAGPVEILCGDFFALSRELLGPVEGFYDRAALVALAPPMRRRYSAHLAELLAPGNRGLLLSLEYPQAEIEGPPFAVDETEVQALFGRAFGGRLLHTLDALENNPQLAERGLSRLHEKAYLLRRR